MVYVPFGIVLMIILWIVLLAVFGNVDKPKLPKKPKSFRYGQNGWIGRSKNYKG